MFGVGKSIKEPVRGTKDGKSHFGPVDERGETFVMAFAGFAEEYSLNAARGTQCFLNEPDALNSDEAVFRGKTAPESHAKFLEPAIVAASEERGLTCGASIAS